MFISFSICVQSSCPATVQHPGYSVISISCLLVDSLPELCAIPTYAADKTGAGTKPCQNLSDWAQSRVWLSQHLSWCSRLLFFWGGCHGVLQQQSIPLRQCGCEPVSTKPVGKFPSASRRWGCFSILWAQCDISSVWHTVLMLCFSHVSCGLLDMTTIGLF